MENIKISFNPTQQDLNEISKWMVEEKNTPITNNANWPSISSAFESKLLIIATHQNKAVGFYTLSKGALTICIGVAEVKPDFRQNGIGKLLLESIIEKYVIQNFYALYLYCAPVASQIVWKKLGFKFYPNNSTNDKSDKVQMYKILTPYLNTRQGTSKIENEIIEIWNDEPHLTQDDKPSWVWFLKYKKNTKVLQKPIVHFGHYEWRIRWRKGDNVYKDCKYKNFDRENDEFQAMIITETTNIK